MSDAERREKITAEIADRTGITEAMIEHLVRAFYEKVRADEMLAPVFDAKIRIGSRICSRCSRSGHRSR